MFQDGNLFDLHFSFWRGRKGLKAEDVGLEEKNIPEIVILGQKLLIPEEEQRKFRAIESKIRSQVEAITFKFPIGVTARFVPFKVLERVIEIAKAGEIEFSAIVENFLADYDRIRAEMLEKYPDLRAALEPHYPDKSTLRSKYAFTWHIYQITTGTMGDAVACPEAVAEEYRKFQQKLQVEMDQFLIIHMVNMIAREDQHQIGFIFHDEFHVLSHRIRRPPIPFASLPPGRGGEQGHFPVTPDHIPGFPSADVGDERGGLVLRKNPHPSDPGLHQVAQGKIDHPIKPAKGDGGFGTVEGQEGKFIHPAGG